MADAPTGLRQPEQLGRTEGARVEVHRCARVANAQVGIKVADGHACSLSESENHMMTAKPRLAGDRVTGSQVIGADHR